MKDLKVIQSAFDNFINAWIELDEVLNKVQEETDLLFSEDYPFQMSFDELPYEVINWRDTQMNIIKGAYKNENQATEKG